MSDNFCPGNAVKAAFARRPSGSQADGMVYYAAGTRKDKNGEAYDFWFGSTAGGHALAAKKSGHYVSFKG